MIKQAFQFLNSFSFSPQDKIMLLAGQTNEITRSVISFDTVQMAQLKRDSLTGRNQPNTTYWLGQ